MARLLEEYGSILGDAIGGSYVLAIGTLFTSMLRDGVIAYLTNIM